MDRRSFLKTATLAAALAPFRAVAADYPTRLITITVPTAPGGTVDIVARIIGEHIQKTLGQSAIVSNRPGAGGIIGTQAIMREAPDGYNILVTANSNQLIVPWVYKDAKFDPIKDFVPIAAIGMVPNVLCVHPSFPAKDLAGFLAELRANPNKYQYASAGSGTLNHVLGELLKQKAKVEIQHVAYRGVAPAMNDVLGNQVPMLFASLPSAVETVQSGMLRAIGVSSTSRVAILPNIPAINEQVEGFSGDLWVAVYAVKGTPPNVVEVLHRVIKSAVTAPEVLQRFEKLGVVAMQDGPEELAQRQEQEFKYWQQVVKAAGITAD